MMNYKNILSWLKNAGIPILIITTTINLGITIYEKNLDKINQKELFLFKAEIELLKEKEETLRKNHLYILSEIEKLSFYQFDILQFYFNPKNLQAQTIDQSIKISFEAFSKNFIIYQRIRSLLDKKIVEQVDAFLSCFNLDAGVISEVYPMRVNASDMVKNGIGYAHLSDAVIKNGEFDKPKANEKSGINSNYSMHCPADLFNVLNEFPYFILKKINSQTIIDYNENENLTSAFSGAQKARAH